MHVMRIIDVVLICAKQRIAIRTSRDNLHVPFIRDSNFIAIFKVIANIIDTLKNYLEI